MPEQLPIYDAQITVGNVKDYPYTRNGVTAIRKGIGVKQDDGTWLNFSCFDEQFFGCFVAGNVLAIGYTQKVALEGGMPKMDARTGQPVIYNTIQRAEVLQGSYAPQPGPAPMTPQQMAPQPMQAPLPVQAKAQPAPILSSNGYNPGKGTLQTAINGGVALEVAAIGAKLAKEVDLERVLQYAEVLHAAIECGSLNMLDVMMFLGEKKLDAKPEDDPDDDIPFEAGPSA